MKNFYISLFILLLINLFSFELKAQFSQVSSTCLGDFTITDGILNKEEEINGYQVTLDGTFKLEIIIPESNKIVLSYHTNFSIENGDLLEIYSSSTTNLPLKTYNGSNDPTASTKDTIPSGRAILLYTNGGNTKTNLNINWTGLLSVTADITNPTCSDSNDGAINLNNPGTSPFTISWTGPDTFSESTEDISNLGTAGDYTISMTDANGCVFNKTYTLTKPNAINYTQSGISNFNGANVSCYGGSNGWVEIAGNGGTAPYNYLWSDANNQTTKKPINLTAGTYDVTISDNNGCTNTFASAATITQPAVALTITDTTSATYNGYHLKCKDDTDASLALIVSGGTGVYNYNWSALNGSSFTDNGNNIADAPADTYSVTVTDANGCQTMASYTLAEPATSPSVSFVDSSDFNGFGIQCFDSINGYIEVTGAGGVGSFTYLWNAEATNQTTAKAENLAAGTNYIVSVTDANNCQVASAPFTLTKPNQIAYTQTNISDFNGVNVSCFGGSNGWIEVTGNGGTAPYSYAWNDANSQTTKKPINLAAGTYDVTITDNNGCTNTFATAATLTQPIVALTITDTTSATYNGYHLKCKDDTDASLALIVSGGTGVYNYNWSALNGSSFIDNGNNIADAPADTYSVTVTDANGCQTMASYTLAEPATSPSVSFVDSSDFNGFGIQCFDSINGYIEVTGAGGVGSFTYLWNAEATNQTTAKAENLAAGTNYIVSVTDANNCQFASPPYTLTKPNQIAYTQTNISDFNGVNVSCFGGSNGWIEVTGNGGTAPYSYAWNDANSQTTKKPINLAAGTYDLTITDNNGCTNTFATAATLTQPIVALTITDTTSATYNGYHLKCKDDTDASLALIVSGGTGVYNYNWSALNGSSFTDNGNNIADAPADTYSVTVTDANGCQVLASYNLTEPATLPSVSFVDSSDFNGFGIQCLDSINGYIEVTGAGGVGSFTYLWNAEATNQTTAKAENLAAGTNYIVSVTDANNCQVASAPFTLTQPSTSLTVLNSTQSNYNNHGVSCFGAADGWIKTTPTGGLAPYTYQWNANAGNQTSAKAEALAAGNNYQVTITDANNCTINSPIYSLNQPSALSISETITHVTTFNGNDGQIEISVPDTSGTSSLFWSGYNTTNHSGLQTGLKAGSYSVTVVDGNNCTANESYVVNQPASALNGGEISCSGLKSLYACYSTSSFNFDNITGYSGGNTDSVYTYQWQYSINGINYLDIIGANSIDYTWPSALTQDLYIRRAVTNAGVSAYSDTIFLDFIAQPSLSFGTLKAEYCFNADTVTLIGSPTNSMGVFEGEGILSSVNGVAQFLPSKADTTINPITITYKYTEHGCVTNLSKTTAIRPVPEPNFTLPVKIDTLTESYVIIDEFPTGGIFSGNGVTPDGTLYTANLPLGLDTVFYKVTNKYNCSSIDTQTTTIIAGTGQFYTDAARTQILGEQFCFDGNPVNIYADPTNDNDVGTFESPISNSGFEHGVLNPSAFSGSPDNRYTIRYNYKGADGIFTIEKEIKVFDVTKEAVINNLDAAYCNYGQTISISANSLENGDMGIFSGTGIISQAGSTAVFDVDSASAHSPTLLRYVYTHNISGCKDTTEKLVTINPLPTVSFDTKTLFNRLGEVYLFQNIVPDSEDAIFEGEGVSRIDRSFNPAAAKLGTNPVTYSYTDANGCKDTAKVTLTVENAQGTIDGLPANKIYCIDGAEDTVYYTPAIGDTFTPVSIEIDGIVESNNDTVIINPSLLGAGTHNLKVNYLGRDGITLFWVTTTFFVDDIGQLAIQVPKQDYCNYDGDVQLTGLLNNSTANWGYFSGNGVIPDATNDGKAVFKPSTDVEGVNEVYYEYTSKASYLSQASTCKIYDTILITVHPRPTLSFKLKPLYNYEGQLDTLQATPDGGYFTPASFFVNDSIFNPSLSVIGENILTYNYTDEFGCFNSLNDTTQVAAAKGIIAGLPAFNIYCSDGLNDTVFYQAPDADYYTPIMFVLDNDTLSLASDTAIIIPSALTPGTHQLSYYYMGSDSTTQFKIQTDITIDQIGILTAQMPNDEFCEYETPVTITGYIDGVIANRGLFTGLGISPIDNSNDGMATFSPTEAVPGINSVLFTYPSTLANSSCFATTEIPVTINPKPTVSFTLPTVYNKNGPKDTLLGMPRGGYYNPEMYMLQDTLFDPSLANTGSLTLSYIYENTLGCIDTVEANTQIQQATGVFLDVLPIYCYNGASGTISVTGITNPTNPAGYFSGPGITDLGDYTASFNPTAAWDVTANPQNDTVITITINYTYKGIDDSTLFTIQKTTQVRNNGLASIGNLNNDKAWCANNEPIELTGWPLFGSFSGEGMTGNSFDPSKVTGSSSIITYTYSDQQANCQITRKDTLHILELPELSMNFNQQICMNEPADVIVGYPRGGQITSSGLLLNPLAGFTDSVRYSPSADLVGLKTIMYQYTNPLNNCTNTLSETITIDTVPVIGIDISMPVNGFCLIDDNISIQGLLEDNALAKSGYFSGEGIVDAGLNTGDNLFNPLLAGEGVKNLTFQYTDNKGCTNSSSIAVTVNPLPNVSFSNLPDAVCADDGNLLISCFPNNGIGSIEINGTTFPSGYTQTIAIEEYSTKNQNDTIWVKYTNTDSKQCVNSINDTIVVKYTPDIKFDVADLCIANAIQFNYLGVTNINEIDSVRYNFGDGNFAYNSLEPVHNYTTEGNTNISFYMALLNGCDSDTTISRQLEKNPVADFSWEKECIGDDLTSFKPLINIDNINYYNFKWEFGDGQETNELEASHKYQNTGSYEVNFIINASASNCTDTATKTIHIRPTYKLSEMGNYLQSFETETDGWIPETLVADTIGYSWQWGIPNGSIINTAPKDGGERIYATNLNGNYADFENSAVTSPCFDFTGFTRPMISFDLFKQMENDKDGSVLEYTTNYGQTWQRLGNVDEGINWYNSYNVTSKPGAQELQGWTDTISTWAEARHDLDNLVGEENVRFRIAFKADNTLNYEGFAFDNIYIGQRTRTVLIEHFTNYETAKSLQSDKTINSLTTNLINDAIDIQYQSSISNDNSIYKTYQMGVSTRESYYYLDEVPYSIFDGIQGFSFASTATTPTAQLLMSRALSDPLFKIDMQSTNNDNLVTINTSIEALETIQNRQIQLFTAVLEKELSFNPGTGTLILENVLRRFLPGPGGEYLSKNWTTGHTENFVYEYELPSYFETSDSAIFVSFIQDENTKEVLQAATSGASGKSSQETSIEDWFANTHKLDFLIFPNPASEFIYITFSKIPDVKSSVSILNQQGKVVRQFKPQGEWFDTYQTNNLQAGVYFVRWINKQEQVVKKLIITD